MIIFSWAKPKEKILKSAFNKRYMQLPHRDQKSAMKGYSDQCHICEPKLQEFMFHQWIPTQREQWTNKHIFSFSSWKKHEKSMQTYKRLNQDFEILLQKAGKGLAQCQEGSWRH